MVRARALSVAAYRQMRSVGQFSSSDRLCKQSGHTCKELSIGYNTSNHRFVSITRSPGSTSLSENHSAPGRPIRCAAMMRNLFSMSLSHGQPARSVGFPWCEPGLIEDIFSSRTRWLSMGEIHRGFGRRGAEWFSRPSSKKKVACRVWLVRCSLYVERVARVLEIGVESM